MRLNVKDGLPTLGHGCSAKTPGVLSVLAPPLPIQDLSVQQGNPNAISSWSEPGCTVPPDDTSAPTLGTLLSPAPRNSIGHTARIGHSAPFQISASRRFIQRTGFFV